MLGKKPRPESVAERMKFQRSLLSDFVDVGWDNAWRILQNYVSTD